MGLKVGSKSICNNNNNKKDHALFTAIVSVGCGNVNQACHAPNLKKKKPL